MNMSEKIKEKAIKGTNTKVSSKIIKKIDRGDIEELNRSMAPIIEQNKKEYREMAETINKEHSTYSSSEEFTDEKAELRAYQFNRYISSCTSYLMDQRLKEKRKLYDGTEQGFISDNAEQNTNIFSNQAENLSNMLQTGELQGPSIIRRWMNRDSKSEEVTDDFMQKLEDGHFDRTEPQIGEEFNPEQEVVDQKLDNYNKLLESSFIPPFEEESISEEKGPIKALKK